MPIGISFMEITETSAKVYILKDIYCNIIYKSQNLQITYISNHRKIIKQILLCPNDGAISRQKNNYTCTYRYIYDLRKYMQLLVVVIL